jgi:hypothetical protein
MWSAPNELIVKSLAFTVLWGIFVTGSFGQPRHAATYATAAGRSPETRRPSGEHLTFLWA